MSNELSGKKVAILATCGFEASELLEPRKALEDAGASIKVVSLKTGEIQGYKHNEPADKVKVDMTVSSANASDFDALLLPGGVANPDTLRADETAVAFVKHFVDSGKPIAAICHGPWTLINAGGVRGLNVTSWPSLKVDLQNAGANWIDAEVVTDKGLVTSRKPDDIPAFNRKMIEEFKEGVHSQRRAMKQSSAANQNAVGSGTAR